MHIYVGIDMSLTSPAVALQREYQKEDEYDILCFQQRKSDMRLVNEPIHKTRLTRELIPEPFKRMQGRMRYITDKVTRWIAERVSLEDVLHLYIEGYAYSMQSSSMWKLFELGGILRARFDELDWDTHAVSPPSVKKFFTGSGKAKKDDMRQSYAASYPLMHQELQIKPHQSPQEDIIDAFAIMRYGRVVTEKQLMEQADKDLEYYRMHGEHRPPATPVPKRILVLGTRKAEETVQLIPVDPNRNPNRNPNPDPKRRRVELEPKIPPEPKRRRVGT